MPFSETTEGQTHSCTYTTDGSLCAECLGGLKSATIDFDSLSERAKKLDGMFPTLEESTLDALVRDLTTYIRSRKSK